MLFKARCIVWTEDEIIVHTLSNQNAVQIVIQANGDHQNRAVNLSTADVVRLTQTLIESGYGPVYCAPDKAAAAPKGPPSNCGSGVKPPPTPQVLHKSIRTEGYVAPLEERIAVLETRVVEADESLKNLVDDMDESLASLSARIRALTPRP